MFRKRVHHDAEVQRKRMAISRAWATLVMVWAFIRTAIVWAALGDYGINPWIYLAIDIAASAVDAFTTPRMVLDFIDGHYRGALGWATVSLGAFIVPDIYIFLGTRTLPTKLIVIVCSIIGVTLSLAVFSVIRKVRAGRHKRALLQTPVEVSQRG